MINIGKLGLRFKKKLLKFNQSLYFEYLLLIIYVYGKILKLVSLVFIEYVPKGIRSVKKDKSKSK